MYIYIYDCVIIVNYDNYGMTMMLNEKSYHCITLIVIFRDILVWGLYGNPAFLKSYTFIYVYLYICIYISNDSAFSIYLRHKNWEWLDSLTPRQNGSVERKRRSHWHEMSFAKWLVWGLQTLRKHHPNFWCYTKSWPPWQGRAALALSCKQR